MESVPVVEVYDYNHENEKSGQITQICFHSMVG